MALLRIARVAVAAVRAQWPWMLAICLATPAVAAGSLEYAVKASYLYKFAPFVEWPQRAFAAPDSPLRICIAGADPFGTMLADAVKGQQVGGRPLTVEHPDAPAAMGECHILFVGHSPDHTPTEILRAVAGRPVLTVTDRSVGASGGMIQFVLLEGRVRFAIDPAAAATSGLQISSKLRELAVKMER